MFHKIQLKRYTTKPNTLSDLNKNPPPLRLFFVCVCPRGSLCCLVLVSVSESIRIDLPNNSIESIIYYEENHVSGESRKICFQCACPVHTGSINGMGVCQCLALVHYSPCVHSLGGGVCIHTVVYRCRDSLNERVGIAMADTTLIFDIDIRS